MDDLVAIEEEVRGEWRRRFPELLEKRIRFPEERVAKYKSECQLDELYSHFSVRRRRNLILHATSNETELVRHLLLLIELGMCQFLDQSSLSCFSRTSKRFYCALSMDTREPVFPDREDVPREIRIGFDTYYIPIHNQIHRITLTRKHNFGPAIFACFVDGELVILHRKNFSLIFLNENKWRAEYTKENKKLYSFYIGDTQIGVQPDGENASIRSFMVDFQSYTPRNFAIFVGGKCISETERRRKKRQKLDCITNCCIILLLPLCLVYFIVLFCCVCWVTACCSSKKVHVRKYLVAVNFTRHKAKDVIRATTSASISSDSQQQKSDQHVVDMQSIEL